MNIDSHKIDLDVARVIIKSTLNNHDCQEIVDSTIELFGNLLTELRLANDYLTNGTETCTPEYAMEHHGGMGALAFRIHQAIQAEFLRERPRVSEICRKFHYQDCQHCDDHTCADNTHIESDKTRMEMCPKSGKNYYEAISL